MDNELFKKFLDIESTSSTERRLAEFLEKELATPACTVQRFEVGDGTLNLLFSWGTPQLVFCTHMDTVPPYIPPTFDGEVVRGRGSCDAKGQIYSLYEACRQLEAKGRTGFGLLLLAGEETGSYGAKSYAKNGPGAEYLLVGEPTDNCMVSAAKGTKSFGIEITGKSCHSGYPENGTSAINLFVDFVNYLRTLDLPVDDTMGETTWNIGKLSSDNPQNILSGSITFRIYFRTTAVSNQMICDLFANFSHIDAEWARNIKVTPYGGDTPSQFFTVEGIPTTTVAFGSDVPHLTNFKKKMLCGAGSIFVAHTANEYVKVADLETATQQYVHVFETLIKE